MTKLSVNINKIATLRNARGGNMPDVLQVAKDVQRFGAEGVTIHPRPDERHIRYQDAFDLLKVVTTEYNIEGNPVPKFIDLVLQVKPTQVTLVPDAEDAITSNAGWDTVKHKDFLTEVVTEFKRNGIRTSLFVDPVEAMVTAAAATGTDRVELYTEAYASQYALGNKAAVEPYVKADLGYSFNNNEYNNGFYYGGGIGISYNNFNAELMYKENKSRFSSFLWDGNINYKRITLGFGYNIPF